MICTDCTAPATTSDRHQPLCGDCIWARFQGEMAHRKRVLDRRGVPAPAIHARGTGRPMPPNACRLHLDGGCRCTQ